jgi:hypothetical protein
MVAKLVAQLVFNKLLVKSQQLAQLVYTATGAGTGLCIHSPWSV